MGPWQVGIDIQIETRRPALDPAQQQVLDRIEADRAQPESLADGGLDLAEREALQETQDLDILALAGGPVIPGAHTGFQEASQGGEGLRQIPVPERSRLVERADLALDERQVGFRLDP